MRDYNTKIKLFTKKGKIITLVTCICGIALLMLQIYINFKAGAFLAYNENAQGFRMVLWTKLMSIINLNLALVLFLAGPAYQVISDQRKERLSRIYKNKKNRKHGLPNLSIAFALLLSALIVVCVIKTIPIKQDIDNNSFITYDGQCTVSSAGRGSTKTLMSERTVLLDDFDIRVKGDTGLDVGKYNAHIVYSEKSKYIVSFSLTEEKPQ